MIDVHVTAVVVVMQYVIKGRGDQIVMEVYFVVRVTSSTSLVDETKSLKPSVILCPIVILCSPASIQHPITIHFYWERNQTNPASSGQSGPIFW